MPSPVNFFIIHGAYGNPEENWFPWIKQKLKAYGNVLIPSFPTPEGQNLKTWFAIADEALASISPESTILIGHSSGALLAMRMGERTKEPFKGMITVCGFARELGNAVFDPLNASFLHPAFNWNAVRHGSGAVRCFAGDDDPYVPMSYPREISEQLAAELIVIKKGGHLNAAAGYIRFPELLEAICTLF